MTILPIKLESDPILRRKAHNVDTVNLKVRRLMDDMLETMYAAPGVGLAAPQIGISMRIIVVDVGDGPYKLANPRIVYMSDEQELTPEGCLSCPGKVGDVWRSCKVTVKALNEFGEKVTIDAEGFFARCLQHEIDHLYGRLYVDIAENIRDAESEEIDENEQDEPTSSDPVVSDILNGCKEQMMKDKADALADLADAIHAAETNSKAKNAAGEPEN